MTDNLICEVCRQAHRDSTDALGRGPAYNAVVVFERVEQELNDELKFLDLLIVEFVFASSIILLFLAFFAHVLVLLGSLSACV